MGVGGLKTINKIKMNWINLQDIAQLEEIKKQSFEQTMLIFKHSTTCSISRSALSRLERQWKDAEMKEISTFYLDLLSFRPISNAIASVFDVVHQSPQMLLIKNGECVFSQTHNGIDYQDIKNEL